MGRPLVGSAQGPERFKRQDRWYDYILSSVPFLEGSTLLLHSYAAPEHFIEPLACVWRPGVLATANICCLAGLSTLLVAVKQALQYVLLSVRRFLVLQLVCSVPALCCVLCVNDPNAVHGCPYLQ